LRHLSGLRLLANVGAPFVLCGMLAGCSTQASTVGDAPQAKYDATSGHLRELAFDATHSGRNNAIGFMDGTQIQRIEVDEDGDGQVDRWEFYDARRHLERVGISRHHNGSIDAMAFYGEHGDLERIEVSTRADHLFDRIEFYQFESLRRVEEDTNGDGRVDKWETYAVDSHHAAGDTPTILTAVFDDVFRGTPTRRLVYRPDGTVLRVEQDIDGDGNFKEIH